MTAEEEEEEEEEELALMRRQYPHARLSTRMLAGGCVRLRCRECRIRPVAREWFGFGRCTGCLDARFAAAGLAPPRPEMTSPATGQEAP